ncbi:MAG: hypothetical protein U0361_11815 [Nitrospiraceae bacterium]
MVSALLLSVYSRERAWAFVKTNWDRMWIASSPRAGFAVCAVGSSDFQLLNWNMHVRAFFFTDRHIELGGKTLEQYLEQLRIASGSASVTGSRSAST